MKNKSFREYLASVWHKQDIQCIHSELYAYALVRVQGVHRCTHPFGLFLVLYCRTPGPCYFNSKIKAMVLIGVRGGGQRDDLTFGFTLIIFLLDASRTQVVQNPLSAHP